MWEQSPKDFHPNWQVPSLFQQQALAESLSHMQPSHLFQSRRNMACEGRKGWGGEEKGPPLPSMSTQGQGHGPIRTPHPLRSTSPSCGVSASVLLTHRRKSPRMAGSTCTVPVPEPHWPISCQGRRARHGSSFSHWGWGSPSLPTSVRGGGVQN